MMSSRQVLKERLQTALGYQFRQSSHLDLALTHCSAGPQHNERLEYLGDAVLHFFMTDVLYRYFPNASEGELSRMRSHWVSGEQLAQLAQRFDLKSCLKFGRSEESPIDLDRTSVLASAFEAVIGACYMDGGITSVFSLLTRVYAPFLEHRDRLLQGVTKDPKSRLQEYIQSKKKPLPQYQLEAITGSDHEQWFKVSCQVQGVALSTYGEGKTRRQAEQEAAKAYLKKRPIP